MEGALRLGKRILAGKDGDGSDNAKLLESQRQKGTGTPRAEFRLGARILGGSGSAAIKTEKEAEQRTKAAAERLEAQRRAAEGEDEDEAPRTKKKGGRKAATAGAGA